MIQNSVKYNKTEKYNSQVIPNRRQNFTETFLLALPVIRRKSAYGDDSCQDTSQNPHQDKNHIM